MAFHLWLTFAAAYLLTSISPGPNVLLTIRNSLKYGPSAALTTILGNLTGQLIVVLLVAMGVGATLAALPQFFLLLKVAGAAYLIVMGLRQIHASRKPAPSSAPATAPTPRSNGGVFREALLVSLSNPKTLIFLSAFMPQFIDQRAALAPQFALMYLTIAFTVLCVHCFYSLSVKQLKHRIKDARFVKAAKCLGGSIFVLRKVSNYLRPFLQIV
ncbi:homoserine/homoserine lactone efflux protein [Oxalobacteraceae bacterium GrIS 1.11]